MIKSKLAPVFAVLLALTLFFGGMLSYKLLATGARAGGAAAANIPSVHTQGIGIQGRVLIQIYGPSGRLLTTWKGHNSLRVAPINMIAGCLSGITAAPVFYGSCSGAKINNLSLSGTSSVDGATTNTMLPAGCDPAAMECTGWQSTSTLDIPTTGQYNAVGGSLNTTSVFGKILFDFVNIAPALSLNKGDRAVVTITFTVS
jgi:hypothetical protein